MRADVLFSLLAIFSWVLSTAWSLSLSWKNKFVFTSSKHRDKKDKHQMLGYSPSSSVSLGFTILGDIFVYVTVV